MHPIVLLIYIVAPFAGLLLAGGLILAGRRLASPAGAVPDPARRLGFWLASLVVLLAAATLITARSRWNLSTEGDPWIAAANYVLLPSLVVLSALALSGLPSLPRLWARSPLKTFLLAAALLLLLGLLWRYRLTPVVLVVAGFFALAWAAVRSPDALLLALSVLVLVISLPVTTGLMDFTSLPRARPWAIVASLISLYASLALPAILVHRAGTAAPRRRWLWLGLAALLLLSVAGGLYRDAFWAQARARAYEDHLPFIQLLFSIISGLLLAAALPRRLWIGILYALLVSGLLYGAFHWGWSTSPERLTEARAGRIAAALEKYHAANGSYPESLAALAPRYLLRVAPPSGNLPDQDWCYQGAGDAYRLGYVLGVYRYSSSIPRVSVQVASSAGDLPAAGWDCDARAAALKTYDYAKP